MDSSASSKHPESRLARTQTSETESGHIRVRDRAARKLLRIHTSAHPHDQQDPKHRHHHFRDSHSASHASPYSGQRDESRTHLVPQLGGLDGQQEGVLERDKEDLADVPQIQIRQEDVDREKQRAQQREDELRSAVNVLSELAHNLTRRLDHTYYSILEKVGLLRATIGSLQELTVMSSELHHNVTQEMVNVESEFTAQIDDFADFADKQKIIDYLEHRVHSSMDKAKQLSGRLEQTRKRVELWEEQEKAWQVKASRRLKLLWVTFGFFVALLVVVLCWRWLRQAPRSIHASNVSFNLPENASIPAYILEDFDSSRSSYLTEQTKTSTAATTPSDDPRLHLLDEL